MHIRLFLLIEFYSRFEMFEPIAIRVQLIKCNKIGFIVIILKWFSVVILNFDKLYLFMNHIYMSLFRPLKEYELLKTLELS